MTRTESVRIPRAGKYHSHGHVATYLLRASTLPYYTRNPHYHPIRATAHIRTQAIASTLSITYTYTHHEIHASTSYAHLHVQRISVQASCAFHIWFLIATSASLIDHSISVAPHSVNSCTTHFKYYTKFYINESYVAFSSLPRQ